MKRRFCLFAVVLCCALAFAAPAFGADYPTPPFDTNAKCLGCHSVGVTGGAFTKTDFDVAPTVSLEKCKACHNNLPDKYTYRTTTGTTHYHSGDCGECHDGDYAFAIAIPAGSPRTNRLSVTGYGLFFTAQSLVASPADLHKIHSGAGWVAQQFGDSTTGIGDGGMPSKIGVACSSCHAAAACNACHDEPLPHGTHGSTKNPPITIKRANGTAVLNTPSSCITPACHSLAKAGTAGFTPTCQSCHSTNLGAHGYENAGHVASDGAATGIACSACHSLDLATEHDKATSSSVGRECGTCHSSPRDTVGTWDQSCVTGGCHTTTSSAPMHAATAGKHAVVAAATACLGCHPGADLGELHALATDGVKTSCLVCHSATGSPATNDCMVCHSGVADAQGHYSLHVADPAPALECVGCHDSNLVDEHLGVAGAGTPRRDMSGTALTCGTCHDSTSLDVVTAIATGSTACTSCHTVHDPAVSVTHASTFTPAGDDGCSGCHSANLDTEHTGLSVTTSGGATLSGCALCHDNTEGARGLQVQTAIEIANDTRCTACHTAYHGGASGSHSATETASVSGCGSCHKDGLSADGLDVVAVHAKVTSPGPCAVCHANPSRVPDLSATTAECVSCHATEKTDYHRSMASKHLAPASVPCQDCHHHSQDVTQVHTAGCTTCHNDSVVTKGVTTACANCHKQEGVDYHFTVDAAHTPTDTASTDCAGCHKTTDVRDLHVTSSCATCHQGNCSDCHSVHSGGMGMPSQYLKKTTACANCHTTSGTDYHKTMATAHTYSTIDPTCSGSGCHPANTLPEAHAPYLLRYPQYSTTCALCHQNADAARIDWNTASADCSTCHTVHDDVNAVHTASAPERCFTCHKTANALDLHKTRVEGKCAVCHANPGRGNLVVGKSNLNCDGCHVTEGTDYHKSMDAKHQGFTGSSGCDVPECHGTIYVPQIHERFVGVGKQYSQYTDSCSLCHLNADPTRVDWSKATGGQCANCHATPNHKDRKHLATSAESAECVACHGSNWVPIIHEPSGQWKECNTCHNNPDKGDLTWDKTTSDCEQCHAKTPTATNHYKAQSHAATESASCAACHKLDLAAEHAKASSTSVTCIGCHTSTLFSGMTKPWATTCAACHTAKHGDEDAKHVSATTACSGTACHDITDAAAVHSKLAGDGCSVCHTSDAAVPASTDCNTCHADTYHSQKTVKHTANDSAYCARCHDKDTATGVNVEPVHKNQCATCHVPSARVPVVSDKTAECSSCHASSGTDYHKSMATAHTYTAIDASCVTAGCHSANTLPEEHARFVGTGNRYPQYVDSCALCHENASSTRIDWSTASADCSTCHTGHGDLGAVHAAKASQSCVDCHETADVRSLHGTSIAASCVVCHNPTLSLVGKSVECVSCHTTDGTDYHKSLPGKHAASETGCTLCHSLDMATEHAKPTVAVTCVTCHETKVDTFTGTWDKSCGACHAAKHTLAADKHISTNAACGAVGCHVIGDVSAVHKNATGGGCPACHGAAVIPSTNCLTCHPNVGTSHHELHNGITANTGGCNGCHSLYLDTEHDLLGLTCATCHDSTRADVKAAITDGNRKCSACHPAAHGAQAVEFDAGNASVHRVRADLPGMRSSFVVGGKTYTWTLPAASTFLKAGYATNSIVTCDGCHTFSTTASGPHGATVQVNIDPAYATPWKTAYLTNSANGMSSTTMICAKCHDLNGTTSKFSNSVHSDGEHQGSSAGQCILCHVQVPHGWVRPRLLGVTTDPAPYASTGTTQLKLKSYTPTNWSVSDCQTSCGEHDSSVSPVWPGAAAALGSITGTVRSSVGLVLPGVTVTTDKGQTATTGANGSYTLAGVPAGTAKVTATIAMYVPVTKNVGVLKNGTSTADFSLAPVPTGTLAGTVTDSAGGGALSGVAVSITGGGAATTAADGTYSLAAMPTGTYTVTFVKAGYTTISQSVTIAKGANTLNISMVVGPTNIALGKVFTASRSQSTANDATKAGDGDVATWWWSNQTGGSTTTEWLKVDLGASTSIKSVEVAWFTTYFAKEFRVYTSTNNSTWTQVYSTTSGVAGTSTVSFTARSARYVRVECRRTGSGRSNGYGIAELRVFQ